MDHGSASPPTKRKFVPELVETTSRSSGPLPDKQQGNKANCSVQKPLQARPSPSETNPSSSSPSTTSSNPAAKPARRFAPQVVETTTKKHRGNEKEAPSSRAGVRPGTCQQDTAHNAPRRFTPQLIETGTRSFRRKNAVPPNLLPKYHVKSSRQVTPPTSSDSESRFSYASLLRRREGRRQSFRVPDLPVIQSSSSDESQNSLDPSSPPSTAPTIHSDEGGRHRTSKSGLRGDACHDSYSNSYFCDLVAVRSAERLLRDQALAAFPNEQIHQPVSHFAIDAEDNDVAVEDRQDNMLLPHVDPYRFRRESTVDLAWELEELRRHKEESEMRQRDRKFAAGYSKFSAAALANRRAMNSIDGHGGGHDMIGGWQKDGSLAHMRRAASPPMLGDDIVFVRCQSPLSTIRGPGRRMNENGGEDQENQEPRLWMCNDGKGKNANGGLWNGTCKRPEDVQGPSSNGQKTPLPNTRLGIVTPAVHGEENILPVRDMRDAPTTQHPVQHQLPSTPTEDKTFDLQSMDERLGMEEDIQREFHDHFITQIYDYLSLGYPCLALYFDEELSKVSHIPIEELRKDDQRTNEKGYVRPPTQDVVPGASSSRVGSPTEGKHARWSALRLYIHEWARQQPRMVKADDSVDPWGARERRGSWGF